MNTITITKYDTTDIEVVVNESVKDDSFSTPYKTATLINKVLGGLGFSKRIPPQMVYSYTTKGTFELTSQSVIEWLTKYINNNNHKW